MKRLLLILCTGLLFFCATSVTATAFYYEANNVTGVGTITYGVEGPYIPTPTSDAPEFLFIGITGDVNTDMGSFAPGIYTVEILLEGLSIDNLSLQDFYASASPLNIPGIPPLTGTYGNLSWDFDPFASLWVSYDFGTIGLTNLDVNTSLLGMDIASGGAPWGVMDADIAWDKLRIEFNPVPEPATMLLFGLGLLGLAGVNRRKK